MFAHFVMASAVSKSVCLEIFGIALDDLEVLSTRKGEEVSLLVTVAAIALADAGYLGQLCLVHKGTAMTIAAVGLERLFAGIRHGEDDQSAMKQRGWSTGYQEMNLVVDGG